jgi:putative DNA primase/helicase
MEDPKKTVKFYPSYANNSVDQNGFDSFCREHPNFPRGNEAAHQELENALRLICQMLGERPGYFSSERYRQAWEQLVTRHPAWKDAAIPVKSALIATPPAPLSPNPVSEHVAPAPIDTDDFDDELTAELLADKPEAVKSSQPEPGPEAVNVQAVGANTTSRASKPEQPKSELPKQTPKMKEIRVAGLPTISQVPAALLLPRWIVWRLMPGKTGGKSRKVPCSPATGKADNWQASATTIEEALAGASRLGLIAPTGGIGFLPKKEDGLVFIDLDDCLKDGVIDPGVKPWLDLWFPKAYAEVTPSGNGIRIIARGTAPTVTPRPLPGASCTAEVYAEKHYLTFTANVLPGRSLDIVDHQQSVDKLLSEIGFNEAEQNDYADETTEAAAVAYLDRICNELSKMTNGRQARATQVCFRLGRIIGGKPSDPRLKFETVKRLVTEALEKTKWPQEKFEVIERQLKFGANRPIRFVQQNDEQQVAARHRLEADVAVKTITRPKDEVLADIKSLGQDDRRTLRRPIARLLNLSVRELDQMLKGPGRPDYRVLVRIGPGLHVVARNQCEEALCAMGTKYYVTNGELVIPVFARELVQSGEAPKIKRDPRSVVINLPEPSTIFHDLDERVRFINIVRDEGYDISPPREMYEHITSHVRQAPRETPFPSLNMVVASPVLLPSGTVLDRVNFAEGVLFIPADINYPAVPTAPTRDEAITALQLFGPLFEGFPFVADSGEEWRKTAAYAVVLAAALTLVARPALPLAVPCFGFRAHSQRTGKTLLAQTISVSVLGHKLTPVSYDGEEEFGKALLPILRHQDRGVLIDNVERQLRSPKLAMVITDNRLSARILGESRDVDLTNRSIFFATGNNLVFTGDLAHRVLLVKIDAKMEHPEARSFSFNPVERAAAAHPRLVTAALTALRAYIVAGKPWSLERGALGGFEEWDRLVAGCLTWLGYADPVETRRFVIENDPERETCFSLLEAWYATYGEEFVSLRTIQEAEKSDVYNVLCPSHQWDGYRVRSFLRHVEGRVVDGLRLIHDSHGRGRYRIEVLDKRRNKEPLLKHGDDDRAF